ncbi:MAG TPA: acyltransferase, partial [Granulicella sp.]|nr:acyltransferase [Granulicella sp.]
MPPSVAAAPSRSAADVADSENPGGFAHIPALDGIRGAAILLVLVYHLLWSNPVTGSRILDFLQQIRGASYCGVNLFFALSGFLITSILLDTLDAPRYLQTFYARRSLRIFPLYFGSLLLLLLLTRPLHFVWSGWQYFYLTYTANLALWRTQVPLQLGFFNISHFWSLQVEEQFYLLWPFVVYRVRQPLALARLSLVACAVILGVRIFLVAMRSHPGFGYPYLPYAPTFSCADNLLFGCALCTLLRTHWRPAILRLAPRAFALLAAALAVTFVFNRGFNWQGKLFMPTLGFTLVGLTCATLIAMALRPHSITQRLFRTSLLRFFGKYSYGLYVFHYSIEGAVSLPLRRLLAEHLHSKALAVVGDALVVGALSVLAALLSYHLF